MPETIDQILFGRILETLVTAAKAPDENPGAVVKLTMDSLQNCLPVEHRKTFNSDMTGCLVLTTQSLFDLSPKTVETNILPVFARFLTTLIARALINYHPDGVPIALEFEVSPDYRAVATIKWAYSLEADRG